MKRIFENTSIVSIVDGNITLKCNNKLIHHSNVSLLSVDDETVVLECPDFKKGDLIAVKSTTGKFKALYIYEELSDFKNALLIHGGITNSSIEYVNTEYSYLRLLPEDLIRLASKEEYEIFNEYCKKHGKVFNFKTNTWEKYKWKPAYKDQFFMIITDSSGVYTVKTVWNNLPSDQVLYNYGNCFKTREEAEIKVNQIKNLFKNKEK